MQIRITDSRGWEKRVPLGPKDLLFIGSGPNDDICLNSAPAEEASAVRARQAQLLDLKQNNLAGKPMMRLINLAQESITLMYAGAAEAVSLQEYVKADIAVGDAFIINKSFTLQLVEDAPTGPTTGANGTDNFVHSQGDIGLSFEWTSKSPSETLAPHGMVRGSAIVRNNGPRKAAQFQLSVWLDGALNPSCEISPTSFALYPSASQEATVWVRHPCTTALLAGEHLLEVRVEAPGAYPNQTPTIASKLNVLPCFDHELRVKTS